MGAQGDRGRELYSGYSHGAGGEARVTLVICLPLKVGHSLRECLQLAERVANLVW